MFYTFRFKIYCNCVCTYLIWMSFGCICRNSIRVQKNGIDYHSFDRLKNNLQSKDKEKTKRMNWKRSDKKWDKRNGKSPHAVFMRRKWWQYKLEMWYGCQWIVNCTMYASNEIRITITINFHYILFARDRLNLFRLKCNCRLQNELRRKSTRER